MSTPSWPRRGGTRPSGFMGPFWDRMKAARDKWNALPDKTWEEGTGFVDNPEKKNWRWGWLNHLGKGGMAGQDWRRAQWDRYKPADWNRTPRGGRDQIKTALQQYHDRRDSSQPTYGELYGKPSPGRAAQQQYAADRGKPTPSSYPTGPSNILKVSSATKPKPTQSATTSEVAPSGPMKIGGTKKKTTSSATMTSPLNL